MELTKEEFNKIAKMMYEQEVGHSCLVCGSPCIMDTEYEGSAVCQDKFCRVHGED